MTLQTYTDNLSTDQQYKLAIRLTKLTLSIWEKYADQHELKYTDTVVGMHHNVPRQLLKDSIAAVEKYLLTNIFVRLFNNRGKLLDLHDQFTDPIVALQDCDWELPNEVNKTFYSVYNLLETVIGKSQTVFGDSTIYVSINQAIDALESSKALTKDQIKKILYDIKNGL
ncbi:MAG TPA: hypothetical protein VGC65_12375 [Bacteroidia bacterium]|jgi:hypothetical protein